MRCGAVRTSRPPAPTAALAPLCAPGRPPLARDAQRRWLHVVVVVARCSWPCPSALPDGSRAGCPSNLAPVLHASTPPTDRRLPTSVAEIALALGSDQIADAPGRESTQSGLTHCHGGPLLLTSRLHGTEYSPPPSAHPPPRPNLPIQIVCRALRCWWYACWYGRWPCCCCCPRVLVQPPRAHPDSSPASAQRLSARLSARPPVCPSSTRRSPLAAMPRAAVKTTREPRACPRISPTPPRYRPSALESRSNPSDAVAPLGEQAQLFLSDRPTSTTRHARRQVGYKTLTPTRAHARTHTHTTHPPAPPKRVHRATSLCHRHRVAAAAA